MRVRVLLTGIFDLTAPAAMDRRMEHAFGTDGQNFWERFFPCNNVHPSDRIVYLFTEHQLRVLSNWLAGKCKSGSEKIRKNLDFSRQDFFNAPIAANSGFSYAYCKICACYIKRGAGNRLELSRVFFGAVPPEMERKDDNDFFDERFKKSLKEDLPEAFKEDERGRILTEILALRPSIEKEFGGPGKNDKKWLCYLGSRILEKGHPAIEYCGEISACSLMGDGI